MPVVGFGFAFLSVSVLVSVHVFVLVLVLVPVPVFVLAPLLRLTAFSPVMGRQASTCWVGVSYQLC